MVCGSCQAKIVWMFTEQKAWMPVDWSPEVEAQVPKSGTVLYEPIRRVLGESKLVVHWATCPDAAKWKKKPRAVVRQGSLF